MRFSFRMPVTVDSNSDEQRIAVINTDDSDPTPTPTTIEGGNEPVFLEPRKNRLQRRAEASRKGKRI